MPIANSFVEKDQINNYRFDLAINFCEQCALIQLNEQPDAEKMFHSEYPFFTGLSKNMTNHFAELIETEISFEGKTQDEIFVVEIGSNDGTLLKNVKDLGIKHIGIDPSENVVARAGELGVNSIVGFFDNSIVSRIVNEYGHADYIFATNVICHIPDLIELGENVFQVLGDKGKFIFEEPYIVDMLEKTSYDQIYDEHVYIFGATSVQRIFEKVGLELVDASHQDTHGGSMRYTLMKKNRVSKSSKLNKILEYERVMEIDKTSPYLEFAKRCLRRKEELVTLLQKLRAEDYAIAGYAATSKSTTVLNFCNLGVNEIAFIVDSTPEKQGKFTPGSNIPIISPIEFKDKKIDYIVLFGWNHEKEILAKEKLLTETGVKWIRFVPEVEILNIT